MCHTTTVKDYFNGRLVKITLRYNTARQGYVRHSSLPCSDRITLVLMSFRPMRCYAGGLINITHHGEHLTAGGATSCGATNGNVTCSDTYI